MTKIFFLLVKCIVGTFFGVIGFLSIAFVFVLASPLAVFDKIRLFFKRLSR